jgi:hypothetical protein
MTRLELIKNWIAELRSGNRKQYKNQLKKDESYCCLGVLCDLYDNSKWNYNLYSINGKDNDLNYPPPEITDFIGTNKDFIRILGRYNDEGKTFPEIADIIEENFKLTD